MALAVASTAVTFTMALAVTTMAAVALLSPATTSGKNADAD